MARSPWRNMATEPVAVPWCTLGRPASKKVPAAGHGTATGPPVSPNISLPYRLVW